ncbi:inorganic phosphate transporter [Demetria terragena]|uniref:inorganic phosphate transporter n=1 Tax=Demetria terragena TaxID=63959 RepID=UPI00037D83CD|nr:inorganic phosphate transporter [Demetria terragena]
MTTDLKPPTPTQVGRTRPLGEDTTWHLAFGGLMAVTVALFGWWSLDYVGTDASRFILLLGIAFGLFMAFNIGGNDVANSFGTSVGAGTLTIKQALLVAAVFEVSGAVIAGGDVTETVRSGIVDMSGVAISSSDFMFIMMAALLAAASWLLIATRLGFPVSTTHSIIGGIVGAAIAVGWVTVGSDQALQMVQWDGIGQIAISWVLSPVLGGACAYLLYGSIKRRLLGGSTGDKDKPIAADSHRTLEGWVPLIAAVGGMLLTGMLLFKGLKNLDLGLTTTASIAVMAMVGALVWLATYVFARSLKGQDLPRATFVIFSWMQVFTACAFAFSHGSNDIANAVGPFAAILDVLHNGGVSDEAAVPTPVMLAFGVALIAGLWFIGRRVITTVGTNLTTMHPASGFSAELAAAGVVMGASLMGLPVSSTHILIGAVLGIGLVNRATNWKLMRPIALAWVITLPVAASIAAVVVLILRSVF